MLLRSLAEGFLAAYEEGLEEELPPGTLGWAGIIDAE